MPIDAPYHRFDDATIDAEAPDAPGVYQLEMQVEIIYYGSSTTSIRDRLRSHKSGAEGSCTQQAGWFRFEKTSTPVTRERQLLQEYERLHGTLPKCTSQLPYSPSLSHLGRGR